MFSKINKFELILFLTFNIVSINSISIKIPQANKQSPITEKFLDFQPFDAVIKFPEISSKANIQDPNILKIKENLMKIPIILQNLLLSKKKGEIIYNEALLNKFKLNCDKKNFKKETIKTDLLIIASLININNSTIVSSKLYSATGKHTDLTEKQRTYIIVLNINYDYNFSKPGAENNFILAILSKVFNAIGFRYKYLLKNFIRNKFDNAPLYLIQDSPIYKSYQKYLKINDINVWRDPNRISTKFYSSSWSLSGFDLHEIMSENLYEDAAITELTMNVFNEMKFFSVPKCDLFKYKAGFGKGYNCLRPAQDCIDKNIENNYFLEYGIYNGTKIKCYLNDRNNIKNNQCGTKYGNLENEFLKNYFCPTYKKIVDEPLISMRPIPELNFYQSQKLKLIKNPPICKNLPRTIFFSVPPDIFDKEKRNTNINLLINELNEINKDVKYDEIILEEKDRKYFVTYEAYEENYVRESVMKVMNHSGVIRSFSDFNSHNLLIKNPGNDKLGEMGMIPYLQKLFSYNNFKILANKDLTYKYYYIMSQKYPNDYDYMPPSFSYPEEKKTILKQFSNYKLTKDNLWLIKPKLGTLGEGIYIFHNLSNVPNDYIITKYISYPHLINKLKYDFRLYVLITGLSPLKIYLYKEGMARFTTEEYSLDLNKVDDLYIHLTNVHINKKNKKIYKKAHDADTEEGSKWSLQVYENYCKNSGIDYKDIRKQMSDISIKSILAVRDLLLNEIEQNGTKDRNHFKLFGYDFLLDENLKVHLIEINSRPSLLMGDINDIKLKPQLVADALNLVGITPYSHDYRDDFEAYDKEFNNYNFDNKNDEIEYDINRALCEFEKPRGRFELIFPIKEHIDYYRKFFSKNRQLDEMLWEKL